MKVWKLLLLACAFSTSLSVWAASPRDGIDRGNGGDEYSQEFVAIGYELVESLMKEPLAGVDAKMLLEAVEITKVKSTSQRLVLRGQEVSAINDPRTAPPTILVNQGAWDRMATEAHKRVFLVLHEYLGIMGVDDSNYQVSLRLDRAKVCERQPAVRADLERSLKKSCYRIVPDDLRYVTNLSLTNDQTGGSLSLTDIKNLTNLYGFYFSGTNITKIEANVWQQLAKIQALHGPSTYSLGDCAFFRNFRSLEQGILWGDASYVQSWRHKPIAAIAEGCFANIVAPLIQLNIDGKTTKLRGFLKGIFAKKIGLVGTNLENIRLEEFNGLSLTSLSMFAFDRPFTPEFASAIGKKLVGKPCTLGSQREEQTGAFVHNLYCNAP
jgi:hypothetical protein